MSTISSASSYGRGHSSPNRCRHPAAEAAAAQSIISGSTGNSSLDVSSLVTSLVNAKVAGQTASLSAQQTNDNTKLSAIGALQAALSALQAGVLPLSNGTTLGQFTATASGTGLTATATSGAAAGTYSVGVTQIASAQTLSSAAFGATTALGTGTMSVSVGGQSMSVAITSANNTHERHCQRDQLVVKQPRRHGDRRDRHGRRASGLALVGHGCIEHDQRVESATSRTMPACPASA